MKHCPRCGKDKDATDFYRNSRTGKLGCYCKKCHSAYCVALAAANPEKHNARSKAWREANPEKWKATVRAWQKNHPEQDLQNRRKFVYKIDFKAMWDAQKGLCASCGEPMEPAGKTPLSVVVDHDRSCCSGHRSCGKCVRGLIHWRCNMVLGYAKGDPKILRYAMEYVEKYRAQPDTSSGPAIDTPLVTITG